MLVRLLEPDPILLDDPIRPRITPAQKLKPGRFVFMWLENKTIGAIVCCAYRFNVPINEKELLETEYYQNTGTKIILYSIWSYKKGCGQKLVQAVLERESEYKVITMSPKTDMAKNFHLKNGAKLLQTNKTTVNYEY